MSAQEWRGPDQAYVSRVPGVQRLDEPIAAWAISGEDDVYIEPSAALIATFGHIITGYIDLQVKPNHKGRLMGMLNRLRKVSKANWLLVHDADEAGCWLEQGFGLIEPPPDVPEDEAVLVLAWGELPKDVYALMQARGLSWHLKAHWSGQA